MQSQFDKSYYKGFSIQPHLQLQVHNNKEPAYTSNKVPRVLVHIRILESKAMVLKPESVLKKYGHQLKK
jgi:predicted GIY-YIG superfamily endonuclease